MAQFNADILLAVKRSSQLDAEIRKLNNDIDKLARKAKGLTLGATGVKGAERQRLKAEKEALKIYLSTVAENLPDFSAGVSRT